MEINILEFDLYRVRNFALVLDKSCVVLVEDIKMKRRILAGKNSWTVKFMCNNNNDDLYNGFLKNIAQSALPKSNIDCHKQPCTYIYI